MRIKILNGADLCPSGFEGTIGLSLRYAIAGADIALDGDGKEDLIGDLYVGHN
jgi:hypothetical protein